MQGHDDVEIALFKDFGKSYRISKFREKRGGKNQASRTVYFLNKILFPSQARIRLRISSDDADQLIGLSNAAGMEQCEVLIAKQLCQVCMKGHLSNQSAQTGGVPTQSS